MLALVASLLAALAVAAGLPWQTQAQAIAVENDVLNTPESAGISAWGLDFVVDHRNADAAAIPQAWLDQARALDTFFTHKSVGNNILDGMADLEAQNPGRYAIAVYSGGASWFAAYDGILHLQVGSNYYPQTKIDGFDAQIRNNGYHVADVAMMKFCPGDLVPGHATMTGQEIWDAYRSMLEALEQDYPATTFVWWTFPLADEGGGNDERAIFNGALRSYCAANGCALFDIADIQSHDPSDNPVVDTYGDEAMWSGYTYDGGHLNEVGSQRVASALWWLLARVAGWGGVSPSISVSASSPVAGVYPGGTAIYALSVSASGGFGEPVSLTLQGEPSGTSVSFGPNPVTPPATSQLYVTTTPSTVAGVYTMTAVGSSGVLTDAVDLSLIVGSATPISFTLSVSPTIRVAEPGQVVSYAVDVTGVGGFSEPVTLVEVGLPETVGSAWGVNPVLPDGDSLLTLSVPGHLSFGEHPFYVAGISGAQVTAERTELIIDYPYKGYLPAILR